MKQIGFLTLFIIAAIIAGMFIITEHNSDDSFSSTQTKVGVVLNGTKEDHSWNEAHYNGLEKIADELNLQIDYRECVPEDERCISSMQDLIDEGCEIIITSSYAYGQYQEELSRQYPDLYFLHATGIEETPNMCSYFGRIYQERYLSGIVAGLQTQTDEIGYVAAYDIPEVIRGINAFTLGVRAVNKKANVFVKYCYSWTGDDEAHKAVLELDEKHNIDIFAAHTDSLKVYEYAEENGKYCIGYNVDNSDIYPKSFLTAPVWNWDVFYKARIIECIKDKFIGKHYWDGIETGLIDLAPLTENCKVGIKEEVLRAKTKLMDGTFDVFYGPIVDNQGEIRVMEGESMTDRAMLEEFNWYVEGVTVDE